MGTYIFDRSINQSNGRKTGMAWIFSLLLFQAAVRGASRVLLRERERVGGWGRGRALGMFLFPGGVDGKSSSGWEEGE